MASSRCIACFSIFAFVVSFVLIITGIIGIVLGPNILQNQISNQLPLTADSDQLDSWSTPPVPIYLQFWLWECTNVAEVINGEKPVIIQHGPFTYLEHRTKVGVYFNDNYTVTYRQPISYTFVRNMSVDDELMTLTMINTPMVTIVSLVRNLPNWTQDIVNFVDKIFNETLFVKHTVGEWLWGYEDPLLKAAKKVPILGNLVPDDHFGYFYGKNGTDDGLYTVFTGGDNIDRLNIINKWNGNSSLTYWKTPWANQINGSDGSWFPPLFNKDLPSQRLYLFSTDVCRSLYATFASHSSELNIPTETFRVPSEVFLNSTLNPDNAGFGTADSGVLNVSSCRQGAPIFISLPHLLYAADQYKKRVEGISPDPEVHQTIIQVEPHTGLVLNAQKRLQINVFVAPDPDIDNLKKISEVILPAIWINESTKIDQKSANDLTHQVLRYFTIVRWVSIILIPIGIIIIIITIVLLTKRRSPQNASTPLLYAEPHDSISSPDGY